MSLSPLSQGHFVTRIATVWAMLVAASIVVVAVCVAIVFTRDSGPPIDGWPFVDDAEIIACPHLYGSGDRLPDWLTYPVVTTQGGCDALDNLNSEFRQQSKLIERLRDTIATMNTAIATLSQQTCSGSCRYAMATVRSRASEHGISLITENKLREACGAERAEQFLDAIFTGTDWWEERIGTSSRPTPTPASTNQCPSSLPAKEYVRCRCRYSDEC